MLSTAYYWFPFLIAIFTSSGAKEEFADRRNHPLAQCDTHTI